MSARSNNIFFWSDLHIGHTNVLKFDDRPFTDLNHMHQVLINNYNASVQENDICYFLGDIGLAKGELIKDVLNQMNGTKVCILGNHDKGVQSMMAAGFNVVLYTASLVIANKIVTLSHCPLRGVFREDVIGMRGAKPEDNWHGEHKHRQFSVDDFGQFHLHGHTHKKPEERQVDRQWDVGVVANNYRPVSIRQVESWIQKHK